MKTRMILWTRTVPLLFLTLYLVTMAMNGAYTALVNHRPDPECLLPVLTAQQIGPDSEPEMIKAQSILARTNLMRKLKDAESPTAVFREIRERLRDTYKDFLVYNPVYEAAARETKGQVLTWKGELVVAPYHAVSSGVTRDGAEVLHNEAYTYLKAVDSSVDRDSGDYLSSRYIPLTSLPKSLRIAKRDGAGYVTELKADGTVLEGEAFRAGMGLSSANFSIQAVGNSCRFLCRGDGHGLGLSQNGGNALAKEGSSCTEILEIYFPELELEDIYLR